MRPQQYETSEDGHAARYGQEAAHDVEEDDAAQWCIGPTHRGQRGSPAPPTPLVREGSQTPLLEQAQNAAIVRTGVNQGYVKEMVQHTEVNMNQGKRLRQIILSGAPAKKGKDRVRPGGNPSQL